jgi:16S rRNA (adenine1518-N6/adenine1519-N6)-dimethyltransferase
MSKKAKKRFGQHFLHEKGIIDRILASANIRREDKILEIGPGLGALTSHLVRKEIELQLVELDRDMVQHIQETWPDVSLHEGDACHVSWPELLSGSGWKCVSNLPYNVGTGIVTDLITCPQRFSSLTVMVQLEVAQRMVAKVGERKRGSLATFMSFFCDATIAFRVPKGAFSPPPKVESAVVQIKVLQHPHVPIVKKTELEKLLSTLYIYPRKTIRNCLRSRYDTVFVDGLLHETNIDPQKRPSHVSTEEVRNMLEFLSIHSL